MRWLLNVQGVPQAYHPPPRPCNSLHQAAGPIPLALVTFPPGTHNYFPLAPFRASLPLFDLPENASDTAISPHLSSPRSFDQLGTQTQPATQTSTRKHHRQDGTQQGTHSQRGYYPFVFPFHWKTALKVITDSRTRSAAPHAGSTQRHSRRRPVDRGCRQDGLDHREDSVRIVFFLFSPEPQAPMNNRSFQTASPRMPSSSFSFR